MRVAEISLHSCPLRPLGSGDIGGMNLHVRHLSQELDKLGVEVDIFTRRHDPHEPEVMRIGERTRFIHIPAGEPADVPKMDIYNYLPEFLTNMLAFLKRDGAKYDLLHSHYWLSAVMAEQLKVRLGIPNVVTFHTLGEVTSRALATEAEPELRIQAERAAIATADSIIVFTPEEKNNLIELYGSQPQKIRVVPGGVDLASFHPIDKERARRELGLLNHAKLMLFAGRIQPIKGLDLLLRAVSHLPDGRNTRLLVVGGNAGKVDELVRMKSLANELGIGEKVVFTGVVEHEKMPLFYNAADVCIIPSYHESFGLVAVEALATGTPVVASRVGGLATIVKDGETGYLVDELSPQAFALHICLLLGDEEIRQVMAGAARPSVEEYAWSLMARRIIKVYEEQIAPHR
jgi:D-inositol-3-phosphate glycosyltransferase